MDYPNRKPQRKPGYDYSLSGSYFITICTHSKGNILSFIIPNSEHSMPSVRLTEIGKKVNKAISEINNKNSIFEIDNYIIMPNHIHFIIHNYRDGELSISDIVGRFKSYTSHLYGKRLWQKSFYDHIIRNEKDYLEISKYIYENPARWIYDDTH